MATPVEDSPPPVYSAAGSGRIKSFLDPEEGPVIEVEPYKEEPTAAEEEETDDDPWALVVPKSKGKPWQDQNCCERLKTVCIYFVKLCVLLGLLYMFVCSLDFLSNAFRLLGGRAASQAFRQSSILSNPIANLMMGILTTVLLQSSSTSTSIVVSMVAAEILPVWPAIFIVMGANIGTSVTNTLVSLGQVGDRNEFRRAFAGATVHDMFNWLTVIVLLPVEWISGSFGSWKGCGLLCQFTGYLTEGLKDPVDANQDLLKVITKPFTSLIIQIDKKMITKLAQATNQSEIDRLSGLSLIKHTCTVTKAVPVAVFNNFTSQCEVKMEEQDVKETCKFMFEHIANNWSDAAVGGCLLLLAVCVLMTCLILIVKLLHSMLVGTVARVIQKAMNANFPGKLSFLTGYVAIVIGWGMTMVLQSSSIFTSTLTPLVGAGILHIKRMYPMTLGANIGTTFTAVLAALASDRDKLQITLQVALCHLFFNILGIMIWYPVPAMRKVPLGLAMSLGNKTAKHRWFAIVYLILVFFLLPGAVFGISIAGWKVACGVLIPLFVLFAAIFLINVLQRKRPASLPVALRTWDKLPAGMHSMKPYDSWMRKPCFKCACCRAHRHEEEEEEAAPEPDNTRF